MKSHTQLNSILPLSPLIICGTFLASAFTYGQDLYFDDDGTNGGPGYPIQGNGTWETAVWYESPGSLTYKNWIPGAIARFQGPTNAVVNMTASQSVGGITKATWGDNFTVVSMGGNTMTLADGAVINNNENILALHYGNVAGTNVTLTGAGAVRFGANDGNEFTANSLTGLTVDGGSSLVLAKNAGVAAVGGNVTLNNGSMTFSRSSQLNSNTTLTQNGGAILFGSTSETFSSLTINSGTQSSGGAVEINLTGANAYTTRNLNFGSSLSGLPTMGLAGVDQVVRFDATNDGTGEISANVMLSDGNKTFNVEDGAEVVDMRLGGTLSLASGATSATFIKDGAGTMEIYSTVDFGGDILVNDGGLSLQTISNTLFVVGANGVSNSISGTGNLFVDGTFTFDLTSADTIVGSQWALVDLSQLGVSSLFTVNFNVDGFSEVQAGIWELDDAGTLFRFEEASGVLSVIPEPSSYGLLVGIGLLVGVAIKRRR